LRCVCDGNNVLEVPSRLWRYCEVVVHVRTFLSSKGYPTLSRFARKSKSAFRVKARRSLADFTCTLSGPYWVEARVNSSTAFFMSALSVLNVASRLVIICNFLVLACLDAVFGAEVLA
jgi:hypothetical protein